MKQYKHIPTDRTAKELKSGYSVSGGTLGLVPKEIVETGNDWQLVVQYPVGTTITDKHYPLIMWKKQSDGIYSPITCPHKHYDADDIEQWIGKGRFELVQAEEAKPFYTILATKDSYNSTIYHLKPNGKYTSTPAVKGTFSLDECLTKFKNKIHSVRRERDGQVFTLHQPTTHGRINRFYIGIGERMFFDSDKMLGGTFNLQSLQNLQCVDVREGDKPQYKILSFYAKNTGGLGDKYVHPDYIWKEKSPNLWARCCNGKWCTVPYTLKEIMTNDHYAIHSVKWENNNVWEIGMKTNQGIITKIETFGKNEQIWIYTNDEAYTLGSSKIWLESQEIVEMIIIRPIK